MYVGISEKLKNDIINHICGMEQNERDTIPNPKPIRGDTPALLAAFWKGHVDLHPMLPDEWCTWLDNITLNFSVVLSSGKKCLTSLAVDMQPKIKLPPPTNRYGVTVNVNPSHSAFADVVEVARQLEEVKARWENVRVQIIGFIEKCRSLNEAIKLWPQIEMYVPKPYLKKVQEKSVVRRGSSHAAEFACNLDTEGLTAAAVIARMSGTQKK